MRLASFLLLSLAIAAQTPSNAPGTPQTSTDQTGTITGVVTDAVTHIPVKKVMVTANPNGFMGRGAGQASTVTDASGSFTLSNLQAGHYRLMFQQQNYPRFGAPGKTVEVKAGESAGPVNMELMPGAAMSGHVVDEDGDPLQNCFVQLHLANNPNQGAPMMGSSGSDQTGEYRVFGIAAGKYIVSAQCGHAVFRARPFSAGPDPAPTAAYARQYYPLTNDAKSAQAVELTAGNEKSGVDFQMSPTAVTQIHGTFAPTGADWHSNRLSIQLAPVSDPMSNMSQGGMSDQSKGTFEFRQVFPGSYTLFAFTQGRDEGGVGAWQRVDVGNKPVELTLELRHAIDLSGKIEIEGNQTDPKLTTGQVQVMLAPQQGQFFMPGTQTQGSDDGTFTLKGVLPAPWRLNVNAPQAFLKQAWLGSTDVTNTTLDLSSGAVGALRILVSTNTATIRGSAPAGMTVMLRRVEEQAYMMGNQGTGVDQSGQYKFSGLAPGKYRLMVMESGGPMPDEGGQEVSVKEGETAMLDLKAPSAQ